MMAQAVGVAQFVEGGGPAAVQPAESGPLAGNFATAFGSATSQASDPARRRPVVVPVQQPVIAAALPKTVPPRSQPLAQPAAQLTSQPPAQGMSLEALLPGVGAPKSDNGSDDMPPPEPSGGKLGAVPRVTLSAPAATNNIIGMAALPVPQTSSLAGKEIGVVAKKTASVGIPAVPAKADTSVVAHATPAPATAVHVETASAVAAANPVAWSDTPASQAAPGSSLLQVSDAVAPDLSAGPADPRAPAIPVEAVPIQAVAHVKPLKESVAEGTKLIAKPVASSAKSDTPEVALSGPLPPLPLALPLAPVASPVNVREADLSTGAVNTIAAVLPQAVSVSRSATGQPAVSGAVLGGTPRVPAAISAAPSVAKTAGANSVDKAVAGDELGKTETSPGGALKVDAFASVKQDSSIVSSPVPAALAVGSPIQAVTVVSAPAPIIPILSGHTSLAADLSASVNVPVHAVEPGSIAAAPAGLAHTTISASPTTLEVGVASGTHGWLKIRAELTSAGEVNASLTGGSPSATTKLRGDLPALSSYLQAEQVQVSGLSVHAALHAAVSSAGITAAIPSADRPGSGSADSFSASADAGARSGQSQHQTGPGGNGVAVQSEVEDGAEGAAWRPSNAAVYGEATGLGDAGSRSPVEYGSGGGWLNVRV